MPEKFKQVHEATMSETQSLLLESFQKYDYLNQDDANPLVKILVSYIKPSFLFKSKILTPIQLGHAVEKESSKFGSVSEQDLEWLHENCEFNDDFDGGISVHNRRIGFFTGTYWAWKNYEKLGNPKYFGSFGYRKLLVPESLEQLNNYDFLIPEVLTLRVMSNKKNFIDCNTENLFQCMVETFNTRYPKEKDLFNEYLNLSYGYYHELYIMKKEYFFDFCSWIYPLIQDCLNNPKCHKIRTTSGKIRVQDFLYLNDDRDIAFIEEMYTGFYLWKTKKLNQAKFLECKFIETEKAQEKQKFVQGFVSFLKEKRTTMIPKRSN